MKVVLAALCLALAAAAIAGPDIPVSGWECRRTDEKEWTKVFSANGMIRRDRDFALCLIDDNFVFRTSFFAPDTNGLYNVRTASPLGDIHVSVNGKDAGMVPFPGGEICIEALVVRGGKNVLEFLHSSKELAYRDRRNPGPVRIVPPAVFVAPAVRITDVFCSPSWRERRLKVEVEIVEAESSIRSGSAADGSSLTVEIQDQEGNVVKRAEKNVILKGGENSVVFDIPWSDPVTWEPGRPYLYKANVALRSSTSTSDFACAFGFREVWCEGRALMMNGHVQRFRPVYSFGANPAGAAFLHGIGYNLLHFCHQRATVPHVPVETLDALDRLGMACAVPAPGVYHLASGVKSPIDEDAPQSKQYARSMRTTLRRFRNHPSVCQVYVSILDAGSHHGQDPEVLAEGPLPWARRIASATKLVHGIFPGVVCSGFGDGNTSDLGSSFCYLNWIPLQERRDWLSAWADHGKMPFYIAEFGQPYVANWWKHGAFLPTEYMAEYYGDKAYRDETDEMTDMLLPIGAANAAGHGASFDRSKIANWYDFEHLFVQETMKAWRGWGCAGGMIHFNLVEGYGDPPGVAANNIYRRYANTPASAAQGRPDWATRSYDTYRSVCRDLLVFLGGEGGHTERRHSYKAGDTVTKSVVAVWDGFGRKSCKATWKAELEGREIASGLVPIDVKTGDITTSMFSFDLPDGIAGAGKVVLDMPEEEQHDVFVFEVYPHDLPSVRNVRKVALVDPEGATAKLLEELGVPYERFQPDDPDVSRYADVIFGRFAMERTNFGFDVDTLAKGRNVLVMAQLPQDLKALGLPIEDRMSRQVFLRDRANPAFADVTDAGLGFWAGAPDYRKPFGNIAAASSRRMDHWTRNHVVAGVMIKIPDVVGFIPLMDGAFDLSYSPLLEFGYGDGRILFCCLDVEGRPSCDPAPRRAAASVLSAFFSPKNARAFGVCGEPDLIASLGVQAGTNITLVVGDAARARSLGLKTERMVFRGVRKEPPPHPLLRGVGLSLLRVREATEIDRFVDGDGWEILADGLVAVKKRAVCFAIDPRVLARKYRLDSQDGEERRKAEGLLRSVRRHYQLIARVLTNLGASPDVAHAHWLLTHAAATPASDEQVTFETVPIEGECDEYFHHYW